MSDDSLLSAELIDDVGRNRSCRKRPGLVPRGVGMKVRIMNRKKGCMMRGCMEGMGVDMRKDSIQDKGTDKDTDMDKSQCLLDSNLILG